MRIKRFKLFIGAAAIIILVASVLLGISGCGESGINVTTMKDKETSEEELVKSSEGQGSEKDDGSKGQDKKSEETESSEEQDKKSEGENLEDKDSDEGHEKTDKNSTICVYICGAVVNEGVYEVPAGSRVSDVLDKAGGYSEEALHGYVNLARTLEDGERVYIPDKQELESLGILEGDGSSSGSGDSSGQGGSSGASADDANGSSGSSADGSNETLVNINTADSETLQTLPGIGEKKAADIIAYREEHGAFSSTEDLKNISGIGDSTFEKLSPHITVN